MVLKLLIFPFSLFLVSLWNGPETSRPQTDEITLQWNKAYPGDDIQKSAIGLSWALSYCGAMLPDAPYAVAVDGDRVTLQAADLGFNEQALQKIRVLHQKIKASDEYRHNKSIDLGRYVCLLIGAPEHYYALTGVPEKLDELLSLYELSAEMGYVDHSTVSRVHRKIRFSNPKPLNQLLIATEMDSVTGRVHEYETIEIMPNAQLRFAIFDAAGNRKNTAEASHSEAGKPAKCMWCHESTVQRMFAKQSDFSGFLSYLQLQDKLAGFNNLLYEQQKAMRGRIDFTQKQQHTLTELLYISFMEPSAERLAAEWNIPVDEVQKQLSGLPTHTYDEFPFLGLLYDRNQVEKRAPFQGLPVSTHVREQSDLEVNHLNR